MVQASELRIGNLIDWQGRHYRIKYVGDTIGIDISETNGLGATQKFQHNPIHSRDIKELQPIPLTPALLEACGFERWINGETDNWHKDAWSGGSRWNLDFMPNEPHPIHLKSRYQADEDVLHLQSLPHIKYLHQLQNLFFCLTGQELEVNPIYNKVRKPDNTKNK